MSSFEVVTLSLDVVDDGVVILSIPFPSSIAVELPTRIVPVKNPPITDTIKNRQIKHLHPHILCFDSPTREASVAKIGITKPNAAFLDNVSIPISISLESFSYVGEGRKENPLITGLPFLSFEFNSTIVFGLIILVALLAKLLSLMFLETCRAIKLPSFCLL